MNDAIETISMFDRFKEAFSVETFKMMNPQMPLNASSHGHEIDMIIYLMHILMLVLCVGWSIFFIVCLLKFNKRAHPKADYHGVKSHTSSYIEIVIVVIEVLFLFGMSIPFWGKQVNAYPDRSDVIEVRVNAEQFAWNVHYPGEDGVFGNTSIEFFDKQSNPMGIDPNDPLGKDDFTTINQLHLPIGKPVIVHLTSRDVIHSFGVPLMRVKQDAIPGLSIPTWFTPIKSGTYEIVCSQLCGLGHYRMKGYITVHHQQEFDDWLSINAPSAQGEAGGGDYDDFWN